MIYIYTYYTYFFTLQGLEAWELSALGAKTVRCESFCKFRVSVRFKKALFALTVQRPYCFNLRLTS